MNGKDPVVVFKNVSGKAEREGLDPAIVREVEEERGPGKGIEQDRVGCIAIVFKNKEPPVRTDILGYKIKIISPRVLGGMIVRHQLDTAAVQVGLDLVPDLRQVLLHEAFPFFG
jgi:hypothetical protein